MATVRGDRVEVTVSARARLHIVHGEVGRDGHVLVSIRKSTSAACCQPPLLVYRYVGESLRPLSRYLLPRSRQVRLYD